MSNRAIDRANKKAKKPAVLGYGTSKDHKKRWDRYYKSEGSIRH